MAQRAAGEGCRLPWMDSATLRRVVIEWGLGEGGGSRDHLEGGGARGIGGKWKSPGALALSRVYEGGCITKRERPPGDIAW